MVEFKDAFAEASAIYFNYSDTFNKTRLECEGTNIHVYAQGLLLIPAIIISIIYAFSIRRKSLRPDIMDGRPGVVYPMNFLTFSQRLAYAACFGTMSSIVAKIIYEKKHAIDVTVPTWAGGFVTVLSMAIYGINMFPVFTSIALRNVLSCATGSLYTWLFFFARLYDYSQCHLSMGAHFAYWCQNGPELVSLTYLCVWLPYWFVIGYKVWRETGRCQRKRSRESFTRLRESNQGLRVRSLLRKPVVLGGKGVTYPKKIKQCFINVYKEWVYEPMPHFQYSARILSILWTGFIVLYVTSFRSIWFVMSFLMHMIDGIDYGFDIIGRTEQDGDSESRKAIRGFLVIIAVVAIAVTVLQFLCFLAAFIIGFLNILYILRAYRTNLRALNRRDYSLIPKRGNRTNVNLLSGCLQYAGYQVGYIAWAFFIQVTVFFLAIVSVIILVIICVVLGSKCVTGVLNRFWSWFSVFLVVFVLQKFAVRFVFLENHLESLALDNRRLMFVTTYFLFFFDVFIGIGSCILRLVKSLVVGICIISRLDMSLMTRKYEFFDNGFARYVGFLHVENYINHPGQFVFVHLLRHAAWDTRLALTHGHQDTHTHRPGYKSDLRKASEKKGVAEWAANAIKMDVSPTQYDQEMAVYVDPSPELWNRIRDSPELKHHRRKQRAAFRWSLAYTLYWNPQLTIERKAFLKERGRSRASPSLKD